MTNNSINFKKERDFGDLFNSTFNFIGQEFKRLGLVILYYVLPVMILSAIAMTVYSVKLQEIMHTITPDPKSDPFLVLKNMGSLAGYVSIAMILSLISVVLLFCSVYCYIKLYVNRGRDGFTINDVWHEMMKYFFKSLVGSFVTGLVTLIGFGLCILPGIYLGIALCLVICIMVFEERPFSEAFGRSMKLVNPNWWLTFGVAIISIILIYILYFIVSIPSVVLGFKSLFTTMKSGQAPEMNFSVGFYVINSLTQLVSQVFMIIPIVLTALIYYCFVEKAEKISLIEKIDQINDNE